MIDAGDKLFAGVLLIAIALGTWGWLTQPLGMDTAIEGNPMSNRYLHDLSIHSQNLDSRYYMDYSIAGWVAAKQVKHLTFHRQQVCFPDDPHCWWSYPEVVIQ